MRKAVIFHSVSGWTRKTANLIAKALNADIFSVEDSPYDICSYDLVVIGTPVYACGPSSKITDFLKNRRFRNLSFFCTYSLFGGITCLFSLKDLASCEHLIDGIDLRYTPLEKLKKDKSFVDRTRQRILSYVEYLKRETGEIRKAG